MEDQVPFKVYTFWQEGSKPEVRRFGVDKNVVSSYNYLYAKVQEVNPKLKEKTFSISWQDEEGDYVKMSSDEEVMTMLTALRETMVKLYVHVEKKRDAIDSHHVINVSLSSHPEPMAAPVPGMHVGVQCDGCNSPVAGFRYKCITCDDFDLCASCEAQSIHSEHCVVRIPSPNMSRFVIKESIKKSRQFLKSIAISMHEEAKKQKAERKAGPGLTPQCSFKSADKYAAAKERREEKRQERREERQERHDERRDSRRDCPRSSRRSVGWMEVFSQYVDQFANLAADHVRNATAEGGEPKPQQTSEGVQNLVDIFPADLGKMMNDCLISDNEECPLIRLNRELNRLGEESPSQEPATPAAQASANNPAATTSQAASAPQAPTTPQAPITPKVPLTPPATPQLPLTPPATPTANAVAANPKADTKSDSGLNLNAESVNISRDGSPDKAADDWTMINKEKDMDSETAAANPIPIGFLPEEFRRPENTQGLYPPLNTATAVYNPKQAVESPVMIGFARPAASEVPPAQKAPTTQAAAAAGNQPAHPPAGAQAGNNGPSAPVAEERRQHHVPHIDAAIRQMIAMGFTNEGGWLTQLLESKDGNIAAVLDLLTPVNPRK